MLQRNQRIAQGEETQAYEINEEVMAMLEHCVSCSLSTQLSNAWEYVAFYELRVELW